MFAISFRPELSASILKMVCLAISIRSLQDATERLRAARDGAEREAVPICINARCDIYHARDLGDKDRFGVAVERCRAYIAAGADCVYPFGLRDPATIAEFVNAVAAPVNVTGRPGMPDATALERLGVARITIASAPALVAMSTVQKLANDLRATGSFDALTATFRHADAQKLFQ